MTMIKKLPLTMAVIAAFFPLTSVMAQEFTQEQIDAIVAKAVDKALATKATAANSRSARPSKARRGLSGILT